MLKQGPWRFGNDGGKLFTCDHCGKRFHRKLYQRKGNHDYCSRDCLYAAQRKKAPADEHGS